VLAGIRGGQAGVLRESRWQPPGRPANTSWTPRLPLAAGWSWSGFMRRYDDGYRAMKEALDRGDIGAPLVFHSGAPQSLGSGQRPLPTGRHRRHLRARHRQSPRFLLGFGDRRPPQVFNPRRSSPGRRAAARNPLIPPAGNGQRGRLVDVEAAVKHRLTATTIRGEILGETGTVETRRKQPDHRSSAKGGNTRGRVPTDWRGTLQSGPTTPNSRNGSTRSLPATSTGPELMGRVRRGPWSPTPGARLRVPGSG